jgi:hypothetical protein
METPAQFEGWAIVELFGHQREIGYVTTRYFGTACMFQVDAPELPERDYVLDQPQYVSNEWTPAGAKVRKKAAAARSRLLGPGSIYALNPCSEEAAMLAIDRLSGREIVVLEVPAQKALAAAAPGIPVPPVCDDCGNRHDPNADCSDYDPDQEIPI